MNKQLILGAVLLVLGMGIVGCSNTAEGLKEDMAKNGPVIHEAGDKIAAATQKAADNLAAESKVGAKNTTEALDITPKVKLAITSDNELNDTRNEINVDSKNGVVHLKGHVVSKGMKAHAGALAEKTLKEANSTDVVSNELTVTGG